MGHRKKILDESVGLARSFKGANWFLELAITYMHQKVLVI